MAGWEGSDPEERSLVSAQHILDSVDGLGVSPSTPRSAFGKQQEVNPSLPSVRQTGVRVSWSSWGHPCGHSAVELLGVLACLLRWDVRSCLWGGGFCHSCQSVPALALPSLSHLLCIPDYQHLQSISNQQGYIHSALRKTLCQIACCFAVVLAFRLLIRFTCFPDRDALGNLTAFSKLMTRLPTPVRLCGN